MKQRHDKFDRAYSAEELAEYQRPELVEARVRSRPLKCTEGAKCWVLLGPPGYTTRNSDGECRECGGSPKYRSSR